MFIKDMVKIMSKTSKVSYERLAEINELTRQVLYNKLSKNTIRYIEVERIAQETGYNISITERKKDYNTKALLDMVITHGKYNVSFLYTNRYSDKNGTLYMNCEDITIEDDSSQMLIIGNVIKKENSRLIIYNDSIKVYELYTTNSDLDSQMLE